MTQVGRNIKNFRKESNLTQQELADKMMVTRQTISGWETGRTEPDLESMTRLAEVLQISVEELIYGKRMSKECVKKDQKKRLYIALIWVAISIVWVILCQRYALWCSRHLEEVNDIIFFSWYYVFKPLRVVLITIAALSLVRVSLNLHISWKWLRIVLFTAGAAFSLLFEAIMFTSWFGDDAIAALIDLLYSHFIQITVHELEIVFVIPTVCIYLAIVKSRRENVQKRGEENT